MKITSKILSIPPYLSTSWYDVDSLYQSEDGVLVVALTNGTQVRLEHLSSEVVNAIFAAHACFLEEEAKHDDEDEDEDEDEEQKGDRRGEIEFSVETPLVFGQKDEEGGESMKIFMEHDPSRSKGPLLPEAMLQRVSALAKMFLPTDMPSLDASHEHCRCPFCQIIRALSGLPQPKVEDDVREDPSLGLPLEGFPEQQEFQLGKEHVGAWHAEGVKGQDSFAKEAHKGGQAGGSNPYWSIREIEDQLYEVTDRANPELTYKVSLATPITCSCGEPNCVHIIAVLKS